MGARGTSMTHAQNANTIDMVGARANYGLNVNAA